jgi:hypothetical protein
MLIEYEDMAAYGARTAFENSNPEWKCLFAAAPDSPERLVSVELLTEISPDGTQHLAGADVSNECAIHSTLGARRTAEALGVTDHPPRCSNVYPNSFLSLWATPHRS